MHIDFNGINCDNEDQLSRAILWLQSEFIRRQQERCYGKLTAEFFWEDGQVTLVDMTGKDQIKVKNRRYAPRTDIPRT